MTLLCDSRSQPLAYINNNMLALLDDEVVGVLLDHCVYGWDGGIKAKFFNHTLYSLEGNTLAKESMEPNHLDIDEERLRLAGWELMTSIRNHQHCPLIYPTGKWDRDPATTLWAMRKKLVVATTGAARQTVQAE